MNDDPSNPWRWVTEARVTYALKVLMVLVLAFYAGAFIFGLLVRIQAVIYILVASVFLAYLIYPAVQWLRARMPLVAAIAVVYAALLGLLVLAGFFIIPHVIDDIAMLIKHYPELVARLHSLIYNPNDPVTARLPVWARDELADAPTAVVAWIQTRGLHTFGQVATVLAGTLATVAIFIVVPVVTAYLLLDLERLKGGLAAIVPEERWHATLTMLVSIDAVIGGFIRGQMLVAVTVGILITIAMMLLHVPYPYLFGVLAALGDLIPYVGAVLAYLPAVASAVLTNGWVNALLVTVAFVGIYELEGHLIAPNVVGRQVRLSAFVVIIALLIGGEVGGLFGMLVAVPVAGVLRVVAVRVLQTAKTKEGPP